MLAREASTVGGMGDAATVGEVAAGRDVRIGRIDTLAEGVIFRHRHEQIVLFCALAVDWHNHGVGGDHHRGVICAGRGRTGGGDDREQDGQ